MANKEKKELTEEQRQARKEAREKRNAAKKAVRDYFDAGMLAGLPEDVAEGIKSLTKAAKRSGKSGAGRGPSVAAQILETLREEGRVSDLDLFVKFKVAQREMAGHIRNWIKKADDSADRVWVMFDKDAEEYVLVGEGEMPPENWDGYIPTTDLD